MVGFVSTFLGDCRFINHPHSLRRLFHYKPGSSLLTVCFLNLDALFSCFTVFDFPFFLLLLLQDFEFTHNLCFLVSRFYDGSHNSAQEDIIESFM